MPICTPQFGPSPMISPALCHTHAGLVYTPRQGGLAGGYNAAGGLLPTTAAAQHDREDSKAALLYFVPEVPGSPDAVANADEAPRIA